MKPKFITFTGVDLNTMPQDLAYIAAQYPVEFGVLFSPSNKDTKYQLGNWFAKNRIENDPDKFNLSAHLCGGYAREVLETGKSSLDLSVFDRVQINASEKDYRWDKLFCFWETVKKPLIIQHRREFLNFKENNSFFQYLYDCSGGQGIVAEQFPKDPGYFVGFAGGINNLNILTQLAKIECKDYYIDMESGVRTNNYFDLDKIKSVLSQVYDN